MKRKKSQSILDFILVFAALGMLIIGITRIWVWFHANYAKRQIGYQQGRLIAGQGGQYSATIAKALSIAANKTCPDCKYEPLDLTEEWVFQGKPSGTVTISEVLEGGSISLTPEECQTQAIAESPDECGDENTFNDQCDAYLQCLCESQTGPMIAMWRAQAKSLHKQADDLYALADKMRDKANSCKWYKPWCWFGSWKQTKRQLLDAADEVEEAARQMEEEADDLEENADALEACCEQECNNAPECDLIELQEACMAVVEGESCPDLAQGFKDIWREKVTMLQAAIDEMQPVVDEIGDGETSGVIYDCNTEASYMCYYNETCYEYYRNQCCQNTVHYAEGEYNKIGYSEYGLWERNCDAATPSCEDEAEDADEANERCSLASIREIYIAEIETMEFNIDIYEQMIADIGDCCDEDEVYDQSVCISEVLAQSQDLKPTASDQTFDDCLKLEDEEKQIECINDAVGCVVGGVDFCD